MRKIGFGDGNEYSISNWSQETSAWMFERGREIERSEISKSNLQKLAEVYGEPFGEMVGHEGVTKIWGVDFGGERFWILSRVGRGCDIEVELPKGESPWTKKGKVMGGKIVDFLEWHLSNLKMAGKNGNNMGDVKKKMRKVGP